MTASVSVLTPIESPVTSIESPDTYFTPVGPHGSISLLTPITEKHLEEAPSKESLNSKTDNVFKKTITIDPIPSPATDEQSYIREIQLLSDKLNLSFPSSLKLIETYKKTLTDTINSQIHPFDPIYAELGTKVVYHTPAAIRKDNIPIANLAHVQVKRADELNGEKEMTLYNCLQLEPRVSSIVTRMRSKHSLLNDKRYQNALTLIALNLLVKYHVDSFSLWNSDITGSRYFSGTGITVKELNALERIALQTLDFRIDNLTP